ncbi:hypothetical protein Gorai_024170, partial [Gossypium raimondii]|nr:hypothetical protein [Gossypium raimondii]
HNILLTFDNIARIRQGFNNTCPRCKSSEETLIHVMKDCPKAREILVAGGLNNIMLDGNYNNCIDWIEDFFVKKGWTKPLTGYVKVNVDASVSNGCRVVRVVARDHDGFVIRGYYNFKENSMDVIWAELEAFQEGLKLAEKLKVAQLIVESDSATLVNTVKKRMKDIIIMGQRIRQECKAFNNFDSVQVKWINHNSNNVADSLCNLAIRNKSDLYFDMNYPLDIHNIIIHEAIN